MQKPLLFEVSVRNWNRFYRGWFILLKYEHFEETSTEATNRTECQAITWVSEEQLAVCRSDRAGMESLFPSAAARCHADRRCSNGRSTASTSLQSSSRRSPFPQMGSKYPLLLGVQIAMLLADVAFNAASVMLFDNNIVLLMMYM